MGAVCSGGPVRTGRDRSVTLFLKLTLRDVFDVKGKFLVNFQMDKVYPQTVDKDGVKIGNFGHFCPVLSFTVIILKNMFEKKYK